MRSVLIVDDNRSIRILLGNFFLSSPNHFSVHEAIDGVEAIEKVAALAPDLIVLEVSMPNLDGIGAARRMREMKITSPIVFFTSYQIPSSVRESIGVHAVVPKLDLTELHKQVQFLLTCRQI